MHSNLSKKENDKIEEILSAVNAIQHILKMDNIILRHKKKLLSEMIWKITEADGLTSEIRTGYKKRITFISYLVKKLRDGGNESIDGLIHEHVYKRQLIIQKLLNDPKNYKQILKRAIGCIVTNDEHKRLHRIAKEYDGWNRYKMAKIRVYNTRKKIEKKLLKIH